MGPDGSPQHIFIIRHGEKPSADDDEPPYGFDVDGHLDRHSLTARGWQRAGALAQLFRRLLPAGLPTPDRLMCPGYDRPHTPRTPQPLGRLCGRPGVASAARHDSDRVGRVVEDVLGRANLATLLCWDHDNIPDLADRILDGHPGGRMSWKDDCFDVLWAFTSGRDGAAGTGAGATYRFEELPQALLPGDRVTL